MPRNASARSRPTSGIHAKDLLRATDNHRLRMFEQLVRATLEFGIEQGLTETQRRRSIKAAQAALRRAPYRLKEAEQFNVLQQISELLGAWYRDPHYLEEGGKPRALPLTGPHSFATLAQRFLPQVRTDTLAPVLIAEKLLTVERGQRVLPSRRAAAFRSSNALMLDRMPVLTKGLFGTMAHNSSPEAEKTGTRCERGTHVAELPLALVPLFNETVKRLAQDLLDHTDAWAHARTPKPGIRRRSPTARVGVEVFSYVENDLHVRRKRSTR